MATQKKLIKVNPADNVIVALTDLVQNEQIMFEGTTVSPTTDVKAKHKIAEKDFTIGNDIIMYGVLVGKAAKPIKKGEVITTENVKHQSEKVFGKNGNLGWTPPNVDRWKDKTFNGYHRTDGQVGTKNVWLFFPLVFCENKNIEKLKDIFENELMPKKEVSYKNLLRSLIEEKSVEEVSDKNLNENLLDNVEVKFINHQGGCGGIRQDSELLAKLLAGYVNNPNVAGATVLSLGCQNLQVDIFKKALKEMSPNSDKEILIYEQQQIGTTDQMFQMVIKDSYEAIKRANKIERKPAPLSKLSIGLECGGSDGFSGISANPALGIVSDIFAALGGKTILAEFPELCGVEQELMNRCVDEEKADKFLTLMKAFEKSVVDAGSGFDMNPSPGNIKDGLITDAMKSAGAAKKGGTSPVVDVLDYGEYISKPGLNLLNTPGNDAECTTGLVGSGATVVLFTTGLGNPMGNPIAPVVKISSNTALINRMSDIIDVNAGTVITGEKTITEVGAEIVDYIIELASGNVETKADQLKQDVFIPWKRGVSL
ncbi:altronate hydrolase [Flavobacterium araucananum]|uniref:Altronate dehydratase n=2 Tax=Flavobacterium TaxID=237 RepID=A0A6J4GS43_9FLAO|nr:MULTISPECIES: altronate dehydratase family protein [Flavobacterium]OXG08945.1 altronate hydrolase [Flavobacterium araucananum]PWJ99882.1 altronate hydrolase [Flavobacterium araucananum]CAA9200954.1 Altronate dehydratase [Flavobacterium bizetiae]CAD5342484.1 Altronate dehydratase [Flavobacterium bizetiae]CAD5348400.1 Altronate dehydratase [Flavobacterium bizetiae]